MNRKKSLHDTLQQRVYGRLSVGSVVKTARGKNVDTMSKMALMVTDAKC